MHNRKPNGLFLMVHPGADVRCMLEIVRVNNNSLIRGQYDGKNSQQSQRSFQYRIPPYNLCNLGRALKQLKKRIITEAATTGLRLQTSMQRLQYVAEVSCYSIKLN